MPRWPAGRPIRRDALRNREPLLVVAGRVFEEKGLEAGVADVARMAGVGMRTLDRRFASKDALIEALVSEALEATIVVAREPAGWPGGTGLEHFLEASSSYQAEHLVCRPKVWNTEHHLVTTARNLIAGLLSDAQAHGWVRSDLTNTDISRVMWSMRGVLETTRSNAPEAWEAVSRSLDRWHAAGGRRTVPPTPQPERGRPDSLEGQSVVGGEVHWVNP
jgi:AcrR family transcriptional regulator